MAELPVPLTARVDVRSLWEGQQCETTYHFAGQDEWDSATLSELAEAIVDYYVANMLTLFSQDVLFTNVVAKDLSSTTGETAVASFPSSTVGTLTGTPLPNDVAWAITRNTPVGGRSGRGRVFHYGITSDLRSDNNIMGASEASNIRAAYENLGATIAAATINDAVEVVVSRFLNGVQRNPPATFAVLNYTFSDLVLDSQRRRLPGRGR